MVTAANPSDRDTHDFYERLRYPGPAAQISTVFANRVRPFLKSEQFRFLDAGCGSGQHMAGFLQTYPQSLGIGIDLSRPSIDLARELVHSIGAEDRASFICGSFSEPIKLDQPVDVAIAIGTIHHSPDPSLSLKNIANAVKLGGIVLCMVYGMRSHRRRYEIREMLGLLSPDDQDARLGLYKDFEQKFMGWRDRTPRQIINDTLLKLMQFKNAALGRRRDNGYTVDLRADGFLRDALLTPIDFAFETPDVRRMMETAGLDLIEFLTTGKRDPRMLPPPWRSHWSRLDKWQQARVMELIHPAPVSLSFVARRS